MVCYFSSAPREKEKDLIIPLIKKNNWRVPESKTNDIQDSESKLKELAVQELLKGKLCRVIEFFF